MNQRLNNNKSQNAAQLRQAFDSTFAVPPSLAPTDVQDLLTIRVAGDHFAIRLLDIVEIVTEHTIVSVPSVTPDLLGLAGIHGGIVPVFGLSSILGYGPDSGLPRWMIICGTEEPIALAFSDFEGHLQLPRSALHVDENFRSTHENVKYVNQIASTPLGVRPVISIPLIMATIRNRISQYRPT